MDHLERLNKFVKMQLGAEYNITEETAAAIAQEIVNNKYRKIITENLNFNQALELLKAVKSKGKKK